MSSLRNLTFLLSLFFVSCTSSEETPAVVNVEERSTSKCRRCLTAAYVTDIGTCDNCGTDTYSSACSLCPACAVQLDQCELCRGSLSNQPDLTYEKRGCIITFEESADYQASIAELRRHLLVLGVASDELGVQVKALEALKMVVIQLDEVECAALRNLDLPFIKHIALEY